MDSREKLEYIANNYTKVMHREANAILKDYHYAEDACQEAFINLCKVIDHIDDVTSPSARAYCIKTAKNCAVDIIRKNNRSLPIDEVYDEDNDVRAIYDHYPSDSACMVNDIEELPDKYRNIIRMRCLEDKSSEETARELGINVNTVNTQLMRARSMLREKWTAIAAVAVCIIAALAGGFVLNRNSETTVNYEAAAGEDGLGSNQEDEMEPSGDAVAENYAEAAEEADALTKGKVPQEIIDVALREVDGATEENVISREVLEEIADNGAVYEVKILYHDQIHTVQLDAEGTVLKHEFDTQ